MTGVRQRQHLFHVRDQVVPAPISLACACSGMVYPSQGEQELAATLCRASIIYALELCKATRVEF